MKTYYDITLLFIFFGTFLAFYAAVVVLRLRHGNLKANRFFGALLFFTAVFLARSLLLLSGLYPYCPLAAELADSLRYFIGPALYFYVRTVFDPGIRFKKYDLLHLLPWLFILRIKWDFFLSNSAAQIRFLTQWLDGAVLQPGYFWDVVSRAMFVVSLCLYILLAFRTYRKSRSKMHFFYFGKINSSWVRILPFLLIPGLLIWPLGALFSILGYPLRFILSTQQLFVSLAVFLGVFIVLLHPEILHLAKPLKSGEKYNRSTLQDHDLQLYFERLIKFMEQEEGYLDPDLTLPTLAEKLAISRNELSRIINENTGKTFRDYINSFRVKKFIALLNDPRFQDKSLSFLASQAGFNSQPPFALAVKKMTGYSPAAFRKKLMQ